MTQGEQDGEAMADDLFTIGEAITHLGAQRNTILSYALKGRLPFTKTVGGVMLFRREDLDAILPSIERNRARWGITRKREEGE